MRGLRKRRHPLLKLEVEKSLISDNENAGMSKDTTTPLRNPGFINELTDLIRLHAQHANRHAVQAELKALLADHNVIEG
jgi:hypothetical protein